MKTIHIKQGYNRVNRRSFFSLIGKGVSFFGLAALSPAFKAHASSIRLGQNGLELDAWFDKIKGKHKIVFDAISANDGLQMVWTHAFLETNNQLGIPDNELGTMVVLRNKAIVLAMEDKLWKKYKLGRFFKIIDKTTNATSERNLYWDPKAGEMPDDGISIKALMERGVMFCVCEKAITLNSLQIAKSHGVDPLEVKKEWLAGLLPGMQPVPSGVLALERSQQRGCAYCFAG